MTFDSSFDFSRDFFIEGSTNVFTTLAMHTTGGLKNDDADGAAWEAGRGAVSGAAKVWSLVIGVVK